MLSISVISNLLSLDETIFDEKVEQIVVNNALYIFLKLKRRTEFCPNCGSGDVVLKDWKMRKLKHTFLYGKETYIYLKVPRYKCKDCNKSFQQTCNEFPKRSRLTMKTVLDVLKELKEWTSTFTSVGTHLGLSNTEVQNIFDKYVNPKRKLLPKILSIDEAYEEGEFNNPYMVVFFDFENSKIVDVIENRSKANLAKYFSAIDRTERSNVQYIIIDMWEPYLDIATTYFPNAIVLIDSFHVMQNIYRALNKTRCRIMNKFEEDTNSTEYYLLKKYNYLLTANPKIGAEKQWNYKFKMYLNEYDLQQKLLKIDHQLEIIYNFWSSYHHFNNETHGEEISAVFDNICNSKEILTVPEFIPIIQMLQTWKDYIIKSFNYLDERRMSNGPIEGLNSQLKKLMRVANGWKNFERFRAKLIYCYNKDVCISLVKNQTRKMKGKKRGKYNKNRKI